MQGKLVHARKDYTCMACEQTIYKGDAYVSQSGPCSDGTFQTYKVCFECAFLISQKTGGREFQVRPSEFTERKIPNFLRKIRTEYRQNPKATVKKYWVDQVAIEQKMGLNYRKTIRVTRECFNRKIINVPLKESLKELQEGQIIKLIKGFNEDEKVVKIKKLCFTKGANFKGQKSKKVVGMLIEDVKERVS